MFRAVVQLSRRQVRYGLAQYIWLTLLLGVIRPSDAAPPANVKFQWPAPSVGGYYQVFGPQKEDLTGRLAESRVVDCRDGMYRIVGPGFSTSFMVREGKVAFEQHTAAGVRFDPQSSTFRFAAVTIQIELRGCDVPVEIAGVTQRLDPAIAVHRVSLILGKAHKLVTPVGALSMAVNAEGNITLEGAPAGWHTAGNRLTLHPKEFVFAPAEPATIWELNRISGPRTGQATFRLLPSESPYSLSVVAEKGRQIQVPIHIRPNYDLARDREGPASPFLDLVVGNASANARGTLKFGIQPAGFDRGRWRAEQLARVRQEEAEKARQTAVRAQALQAAATADWQRDFVLADYMQIYDFPEQLVSYAVEFPAEKVRAAGLSLVAITDDGAEPVAFQLSRAVEERGFLRSATIAFRTDLPRGGTRRFQLLHGARGLSAPPMSRVTVVEKQADAAVLAGNLLRVKVPLGHKTYQPPLALADAPAPIRAVARVATPQQWQLAGSFHAPPDLQVLTMEAGPVEEGPLWATYHVCYRLGGGRTYTVLLTLQHNETSLSIDETFTGFRSADGADFCLDFTTLNPDRRQAMANGGYQAANPTVGYAFSGAFDEHLSDSGKLPLELGLNVPNSLGVMRSCAFWNEQGPDALLLALDRLREWKTERRYVWNDSRGPGNLNFYQRQEKKYLLTRLEGTRRLWCLALIPRKEMVNKPHLPGKRFQRQVAGPEVRLFQQHADFNLDRVKDWGFEWNEPLPARLFRDVEPVSCDEWLKRNGLEGGFPFLSSMVNCYWDFSSSCGAVSFRDMPRWFGQYERSRADWTEAQRKHIRAILLLMAYSSEDDYNLPHHSMLAGHPNFISDVKQVLPLACAVFSTHPQAPQWKASFLKYYHEWLDTYQRHADPASGAIGGRWTENIACYSGQALEGLLHAADALRSYDGTDLLDHPRVRDWIGWYVQSMMAPHEGVRMVPPEGAHTASFEPGMKFHKTLFEIARQMKPTAPELSAQMAWIGTNGREGSRPPLRSVLVRDYGPVLRHDFGGPHEAYAHLLQIDGPYNYRWGEGSGTLYYAARNRVWSYNGREDNGDRFDINNITAFSVGGKGLGRHATDQPLLDFDFVQFYRALADPNAAGQTGYCSRAVLMARDDYLAVFDEVANPQATCQFVWANVWQLPEIYQLNPGAACEETTISDADLRDPQSTRSIRLRRYRGKGSFLTVVAPEPIEAKATPYGAILHGKEQLFFADAPLQYNTEELAFEGTAGYAGPGQLAILEGTRLRSGPFEIGREGGDFGFAASVEQGQIRGWIAGRRGGTAYIRAPGRRDLSRVRVLVAGQSVPVKTGGDTIRFDVHVSAADGRQPFSIQYNTSTKDMPAKVNY